jgi:signal transduction histidine kinase
MFTGIVRDITERRRTDELHHAKEAAEQANLAKSKFLASMSHELRTPLHAIIGFTNLMLRNKEASLSGQERDFLQRILSNAKDQLQLINGILDLSKVEAGRMELQLTEIAIDDLISDVVRQLEGRRRNPEVNLVVKVPDVMAPVQADAARLKQVLLNLMENGLKFTSHGTVTIAVDINPINLRPVRIDVTDTGIGIPPERLQDIFEPFRQVEESTSPREGSGLGLSICRSLCELMRYRLEVRSDPGAGSTFSVILEADARQIPLSA